MTSFTCLYFCGAINQLFFLNVGIPALNLTIMYFFRRELHRLMVPVMFMFIVVFNSCKKDDNFPPHGTPSSHSSIVIDKWITMQLRLMRNATGIPNQAFSRHFAYTGVAALQSMEPGLHGYAKWKNKWNGLTGLPTVVKREYYYPANVNAAMARINRDMFPNASVADKAAIDSLENALTTEFLTIKPAAVINASADFGKAVATAVFNWAETDGYKNANNAYQVPVGPGLWKPTPPAFAPNPATPYWGNNRTIIVNSTQGASVPAPVSYSTDPSSPFYAMVKELYDVSKVLTDDQKAAAIFWRDVPGATSPGHWLSIMQQLMKQKNTSLDVAAVAYALTGTAINDALIVCFKNKYQYNLVRPVTYIREVMLVEDWNSYIGTPAHPEYPSAHSSLSVAAANILDKIFPNVHAFTDHTYDYMNLAPRNYSSLNAIAAEAGMSRLYAGIHYRKSIEASTVQANKVTANILK
jgi:hypothetical protein